MRLLGTPVARRLWLSVYAATLIKAGIAAGDACRMALVRPITDDRDIRETLDHAIDAVFA
jgi:nitric oxide reductase NorQ protein